MANLTITIDDEMLKRARIRALEQGTSVNALLRLYLIHYVGGRKTTEALEELVELAVKSQGGSGEGGRKWTREDIYER
jgi:plasmid stability protein